MPIHKQVMVFAMVGVVYRILLARECGNKPATGLIICNISKQSAQLGNIVQRIL
jgi:hypothetical protein